MSGSNLAKVTDLYADEASGAKPTDALVALNPVGRLTLVSTLKELAALEPQWSRLEHECNSPSGFFQSFAWVYHWSSVYSEHGGQNELCILTGYDGDKLAFVWPLMKVRQGPLTILRWLTDPFGQYGDIIVQPGQNIAGWMTRSMQTIAGLSGVDAIRLRHVRQDALCAPFLLAEFKDAISYDQAPYLDLKQFADEAAYDARYTSVQRKRRKKIRKALEEKGELDFHQVPSGSMGDAVIDEAIVEKNKWLDERGRQNRFLKCPNHAKFLKQLSRHKQDGLQTVLTELTAGSEAVSWEIGFNYRGTHYGFITSHRNDLTNLSPSRLHMDLSQRLSLRQGMDRFDLMVPNDAHKESWSSHKTATNDYYKPLSISGQAYGLVYLRALRPRLRAAYYRAPQWALRWITAFMAIMIAN